MKCAKFHILLNDYIDKTLSPDAETRVKKHLEKCEDCRSLLEDLIMIKQKASDLGEIAPPDDGWDKIERELSRETRSQPSPSWIRSASSWIFQGSGIRHVLAAALLLAVMVSVSIVGLRIGRTDGFMAADKSQRQTLAKLKRAETHYRKAIRALNEAVTTRKDRFDPEIYQAFQEHLDVLDDSIQACRQAVLKDPTDIEGRNTLLTVYKEKTDLLSGMMVVSDDASRLRELKITL